MVGALLFFPGLAIGGLFWFSNNSGDAPSLHSPKSKAMRPNTDTTESTTSAGKPASCITVTGLPFAGRRNRFEMMSAMVSPPTLAFSNMKE